MNKEFFVSDEITQKISKFDSIIFDCDGVLVDIRNSYDEAINKTISAIMKELFDDNIDNIVTSKIHFGLKSVGGFNDEVAVVYAVLMTLIASKKSNIQFEKLIIDVINNANESGINSIDAYFVNKNIDLTDIKSKLDYENSRKESYIHRIFNQLFYGPSLYQEIFNEKSTFSQSPLIDLDKIILDENLILKLKNPIKEMFDKNALLVKETYDFAEGKNKEAEIKLKMYREKLQNFNAEERKAKNDGEKEVKTFRERRIKETESLLKRLEQDAANKIKHEKRILIDELNHAFLDAVINQARSTISNNEDSQKKATKNLLSEI